MNLMLRLKMQFECLDISIPFKSSFRHASSVRDRTESFFVKVVSDQGLVGYGESCPRSYVTGESVPSCVAFLNRNRADIGQISDLDSLRTWVVTNSRLIDQAPAAWCAIELALLDVLAKQSRVSVAELLHLPEPKSHSGYSAIIGANSVNKAILFRLMGFKDFKLKVTEQCKRNDRMFKLLRCLAIGRQQLRLDANNSWSTASACIDALAPYKTRFWAIEEPIQAFDFSGMKKVAHALDCKVILDESLLSTPHLQQVIDGKAYFLANVRLSRLGGVLRTVETIRQLVNADMPFIFGSHVGESSLLASVQHMLATRFANHIVAVEGGFGTWLLQHDPFHPNLKIGFGGRLSQSRVADSDTGWGIDYVD